MNRLVAFGIAVLVGVIGGIVGSNIWAMYDVSYDAQSGTLFVYEDGSVVSTDVESFDQEQYKVEELEKYVDEQILDYETRTGKDAISLHKLKVEDGVAKLTLEYDSAADYQEFCKKPLFAGTVAEAVAAGYDFAVSMVEVETKNSCFGIDAISDDSWNVAIVKGNTDLCVDGEILYYSTEDVTLLNSSTIRIQKELPENTKETGQSETTEPTETAEEGSISDDEMLTGTEQVKEIYTFTEDAEDVHTASESQVYTYVIYQ